MADGSGKVRAAITGEIDAVVIGAGFGGMYMPLKLREAGLTAQGFEAGTDVGGTWYWNRYPGARCDIPSLFYSYTFDEGLQKEWRWTEKYAAQPEILRYANHVADRFELVPADRLRDPRARQRPSMKPPTAGPWSPTGATRSAPAT